MWPPSVAQEECGELAPAPAPAARVQVDLERGAAASGAAEHQRSLARVTEGLLAVLDRRTLEHRQPAQRLVWIEVLRQSSQRRPITIEAPRPGERLREQPPLAGLE